MTNSHCATFLHVNEVATLASDSVYASEYDQSKQFIYYYSGPIVALPRKSFLTCKLDVYFSEKKLLFSFFFMFSHTYTHAFMLLVWTLVFCVFAAPVGCIWLCEMCVLWLFFFSSFHCFSFQFISMFCECVAHFVHDEQILGQQNNAMAGEVLSTEGKCKHNLVFFVSSLKNSAPHSMPMMRCLPKQQIHYFYWYRFHDRNCT